jgi:hypothetical protein
VKNSVGGTKPRQPRGFLNFVGGISTAVVLTRWLARRSILLLVRGSQFFSAKLVGFVASATEQTLVFMIAACFERCKITWSFVRGRVVFGGRGVLSAPVIGTVARRRTLPHSAH